MQTKAMYSTGEIAKLCNISVRTVQYYDSRELVIPTGISEGGRRLYSNEDLAKEANSKKVISLLLKEQKSILESEIKDKENKLKILAGLEECLEDSLSADLIEKVNTKVVEMENKQDQKALWKIRGAILGVGIPVEIIEVATFIFGLKTKNWWPFAIGMVIAVIAAIWISKFYLNKVNYICPECNKIFKPSFKEAFWANHTPTTRKLTCPHCNKKSYCVETTKAVEE